MGESFFRKVRKASPVAWKCSGFMLTNTKCRILTTPFSSFVRMPPSVRYGKAALRPIPRTHGNVTAATEKP